MRTLGLDPIEVLVLPRLLALMISLPLLAFFGDMTGLLGGARRLHRSTSTSPLVQFFDRLRDAVGIGTSASAWSRRRCSRFIIAADRLLRGAAGHAAAPRASASSPPARWSNAIFLVIVLDAVFSIIFLLAVETYDRGGARRRRRPARRSSRRPESC